VGFAWRLPSGEDPHAFEKILRNAGILGGDYQVMPRETDRLFEDIMKGEAEKTTY
jgi:hypothetical protein